MRKYKLTDNTKVFTGRTLHQIEALIDIEETGVSAGDLGGWVESEDNLSQEGAAWVYGHARVYGYARVYGHARVYGEARVSGYAWVSDHAQVYGEARVYGEAWVCGHARVYGGEWEASPPHLCMHGPYDMYMPAPGRLRIGCQDHTFEEWRERYAAIAADNDISGALLYDYVTFINAFILAHGDGVVIEMPSELVAVKEEGREK